MYATTITTYTVQEMWGWILRALLWDGIPTNFSGDKDNHLIKYNNNDTLSLKRGLQLMSLLGYCRNDTTGFIDYLGRYWLSLNFRYMWLLPSLLFSCTHLSTYTWRRCIPPTEMDQRNCYERMIVLFEWLFECDLTRLCVKHLHLRTHDVYNRYILDLYRINIKWFIIPSKSGSILSHR